MQISGTAIEVKKLGAFYKFSNGLLLSRAQSLFYLEKEHNYTHNYAREFLDECDIIQELAAENQDSLKT